MLAPSDHSLSYSRSWNGSAIALTVVAIRSRSSGVVGEFNDLLRMVDLCAETGYQLLPINSTSARFSYRNSYSYSVVSSLHAVLSSRMCDTRTKLPFSALLLQTF